MRHKSFILVIGFFLVLGMATVAWASHSWGGYHWGRTSSSFVLELGDNVSGVWDNHLAITAGDWSISNVLDTVVMKGKTKPRNCRATLGRVEVCNSGYGFNGWLGLAQIWVRGEHIVQGVVKVNDSYFNLEPYNSPAWRNLVMCQEVGHTLGLGHTDENFYNQPDGTCMDYSADPGPNQHPNQHDYEMLEEIYAHLDGVNTYVSSVEEEGGGRGDGNGKGKPAGVGQEIDLDDPAAWGQVVKQDARGRNSLYRQNLSNGESVFTFVIWVEGTEDGN